MTASTGSLSVVGERNGPQQNNVESRDMSGSEVISEILEDLIDNVAGGKHCFFLGLSDKYN